MRKITFAEATLEALQGEFRRDEKTVHLGTDVAIPLRKEFGAARIRGTPIAESSFVGAAIGLAGSGFRPVVNLRMATFGFVAMDQMVNQAAKIAYMFGGQARFPIVLRMTVGAGQSMAAQHSISPYPMYMNVPGLKIILPSTPYDAKGLLKTAIRDNNPGIGCEDRPPGGGRRGLPDLRGRGRDHLACGGGPAAVPLPQGAAGAGMRTGCPDPVQPAHGALRHSGQG